MIVDRKEHQKRGVCAIKCSNAVKAVSVVFGLAKTNNSLHRFIIKTLSLKRESNLAC